ncbi:MAG: NADH-quinone oxidoreductase subunit M, partial [Parachlamydia sp.]|nr:NADH-quinone oxidoreductase subunit M [Parachlamydia sp.]
TLFWESILIPLFFMITIWGGSKKYAAALKFLVYMLAGSFLLIVAVIALYLTQGSFDLNQLILSASTHPHASWLAAIFLLAFAVKTPLFPFHGWLPDTYFQTSTSGTIFLSALLSKAGVYGFLRIGAGLFPEQLQLWSPWLLGLSVAGVLYGALAAWRQSDYKKILAYSSLSHVNFILVGLFVWNEAAQQGALLQAFNHGITITALFLAAGWLEDRVQTTALGPQRGLARYMPLLAWTTLFFVLSSVALPGTNNFAGELLIFFGLFQVHPFLTALLGLLVILSVVYMLRFMQKIYFEEPVPYQERWIDLKGSELAIALPLILIILWIGFYPMTVLRQIQPPAVKMENAA